MARKLTEPAMVGNKPYKAPSRLRVSGPKAKKLMSGVGVGKRHTFKVTGKVAGVSSNEFDDSIEMDLEHCEHCDDQMPESLSRAMKRRRGAKGRFV